MKKVTIASLVFLFNLIAYGANYTSPQSDAAYTTRALWHFNEYSSTGGGVFFNDDDSNNPGRSVDMQLLDGATFVQTGGSSGPFLVDSAAAGIGYPNSDPNFGKCAYFDGVNDLALTDSAVIPIDPANFWIGGWVKLPASFEPNLAANSPAKTMMLFERYGQVAIRIADIAGTDGMVIQPMFWNADKTFLGWKSIYYSTIGVDFHQWHHIAVEVKNRNMAKCYINGIARGGWALSTIGVAAPTQPYTRFGVSYSATSPYPFWGYIDEWHVESGYQMPWDKLCGGMGYSIGDLDKNCIVDMRDVQMLASKWLASGDTAMAADLNGDKTVEFRDMAVQASELGVSTDPVKADAVERKLHGYNYNYPAIDIRSESGSTMVYWGSDLIVEVRDNRRLRFRATPADDHWVGKEATPMDLCWAYEDDGVCDYASPNVTFNNNPQDGHFTINLTAIKPSVSGTITVTFDGYWNPKNEKFHYLLSSRIQCPLENWYLHSVTAMNQYNSNPMVKPGIEFGDYHIENNSWPDILPSNDPTHAKLYKWQLFSTNGTSWTLLPKTTLPGVTRSGSYATESTGNLNEGSYFGFIDPAEGGWISQIIESPAPMEFSQCWMYFDVHHTMPNVVPLRHSQQSLDLTCKLHFVTVEPQDVAGIMAASQEVSWKTQPEYQLPVFTRNNTFDQLITDPCNSEQYMWWASSYDCSRVTDTGYDDHYCVTINHGSNNTSAAWYARCWGYLWDSEHISGTYRVSAKVKTSNCTGTVRLAVAQCSGDYWIYGTGFDKNAAQWTYSTTSLSGTNNWTDLQVTVPMTYAARHIVLEHIGPGQSWFDNVVIEKVP